MLNGILIGAAMMGAMWAAAYVERLGREAEAERRAARAAQAQRRAQRHIWCDNIAELTIDPAAFDPAAPTVSPDFAPGRYIL